MNVSVESCLAPFTRELNAIYLNGAETAAHAQMVASRIMVEVKIDQDLLRALQPGCIILDPMQRTEPLICGVHSTNTWVLSDDWTQIFLA